MDALKVWLYEISDSVVVVIVVVVVVVIISKIFLRILNSFTHAEHCAESDKIVSQWKNVKKKLFCKSLKINLTMILKNHSRLKYGLKAIMINGSL